MRILKYILLLLLLAIIGLTVYVATQPGEYETERSKVIKAQKSVVFSYVNDYKNWEDFGAWKDDDPNMQFTYSDTTIGKGASYSWKGNSGEGKTETIFEKENDSIAQKVVVSGNEGKAYLTFKDTVGGTKVTWHSKGKLNFMAKAYAVLKGGVEKMVGDMQERTLAKLDKVISYEINTYSIKVDGVVQKTGGYYFQQKITCKIPEVQKNVNLILPNMLRFFKENNITLTGSPFVLYETYDVPNNKASFSVCLPMREEIFTAEGSDYTSGKLEPYQALKTTLHGDYSHSKEAWDKAFAHIKKNNLVENKSGSYIEVYSVSAAQVKNPSKWVTEIYVPVGSSAPVEAATAPAATSETATTAFSTTAKTPATTNAAKTKTPVQPAPKPAVREAKVIE